MDAETLKLGLLMEAAQANQKLADSSLKKLRAQSQDLALVVRDELRRAVMVALQSLADENERAADALRSVQRVANVRVAVWSLSLAVLCSAVPLGLACWIIPSRAQIRALSAQRAQLVEQIAVLEGQGARIDVRRCGEGARLCVRVDRMAPAYGEKSDYLVVKGY